MLGAPFKYRNCSAIFVLTASKYDFEFSLTSLLSSVACSLLSGSSPHIIPVSYAQQRATFLIVYPPPPTTSIGILNFFINFTHSPCPRTLKLNTPSRSNPSESAPHCITIDDGLNTSTTCVITDLNNVVYSISSIPSFNGTLTVKYLPSPDPSSSIAPVPGKKSPLYL
ncbi:hypothetical protein AYI70_g6590 [Smittium culicis]|uniref:Uncharacterized protein n=1 Tax=Smittium culicis TaxID=133412 RepID=A0A1R1XP92_9FUNG|nr:hypothetical protein AYI70_g6590 [Smittium culicis]